MEKRGIMKKYFILISIMIVLIIFCGCIKKTSEQNNGLLLESPIGDNLIKKFPPMITTLNSSSTVEFAIPEGASIYAPISGLLDVGFPVKTGYLYPDGVSVKITNADNITLYLSYVRGSVNTALNNTFVQAGTSIGTMGKILPSKVAKNPNATLQLRVGSKNVRLPLLVIYKDNKLEVINIS